MDGVLEDLPYRSNADSSLGLEFLVEHHYMFCFLQWFMAADFQHYCDYNSVFFLLVFVHLFVLVPPLCAAMTPRME